MSARESNFVRNSSKNITNNNATANDDSDNNNNNSTTNANYSKKLTRSISTIIPNEVLLTSLVKISKPQSSTSIGSFLDVYNKNEESNSSNDSVLSQTPLIKEKKLVYPALDNSNAKTERLNRFKRLTPSAVTLRTSVPRRINLITKSTSSSELLSGQIANFQSTQAEPNISYDTCKPATNPKKYSKENAVFYKPPSKSGNNSSSSSFYEAISKENTAEHRNSNIDVSVDKYDNQKTLSNCKTHNIEAGDRHTLSVMNSNPNHDGNHKTHNDLSAAKKKTFFKKYKLAILAWVLILVILIMICVFIPILVILSRGTRSSVLKYFENSSDSAKKRLLDEITSQFYDQTPLDNGSELWMKKQLSSPYALATSTETSIPYSNKNHYLDYAANKNITPYDVSILRSLPLQYQYDSEVLSILTKQQLRQTFDGINYSPAGVMYPLCGINERDVLLDVLLLSRVTTKIRTYGLQCNQVQLILNAIEQLNLNMTVSLGVWVGKNKKQNLRQLAELKKILKAYDRSLFENIIVGNEVLFRNDLKVSELIGLIVSVKQDITENLKITDLPVGTADIPDLVTRELLDNVDFFGANIQPFFTGQMVQTASDWVFESLESTLNSLTVSSKPKIVISEVGWPYDGGSYNESIAKPAHFEKFLKDWVCKSKNYSYQWYYFEAFDEPWKRIYYNENNTWETEWGIFDIKRNLKKGVELPICNQTYIV
ncbi:uncharacterized protein SCODWIG_02490 [Saccharomycodes ludwigii]|uniref:glucan endo-1,3-beta-D-glucosidase n=1 Tax=Saccharomycodes ludwigii TaxID=36035 RepID=A0A376B831_9ASCO|nr:hypothetical protein SCDLUD_000942 [Saccharomycodes ludwigii]KAH3903317.1 hypothetical protein SCDLUD_000942 [Saccharomycodes ludwigii]SSD60729.1 uncharacterized protein SCODWIG_02490 [Saccharomycodes ludwigii]